MTDGDAREGVPVTVRQGAESLPTDLPPGAEIK